jgi:hypothetical protein
MRKSLIIVSIVLATSFGYVEPARTQTRPRTGAAATQPETNLRQLMRAMVFPNANVVFSAQTDDPAKVKPAKEPPMATDPLAGSFGQWEAVENSALALSEVANLLLIPGRRCANGRDVPLKNADWPKFVQGLREAGKAAYKAAQTKDMDKVLDASEIVANACENCHDQYREKMNLADRCK